MKILFLSHYFPPEVNAPATRTYEHCRRWVERGHEVTVVTCTPHHPMGKVYPGYRNRIFQAERKDGIRVVRVYTYITPNERFVRRTWNYVLYMIMVVLAAPFLHRTDLVISTSPQFFNGLAGYFVSRIKRCPWVLEVRDLWPASIVAVGAIRNQRLIACLEAIERFVYRKADHIVSVTKAFRRHILARGGRESSITIIRNGVDLQFFIPQEKDQVYAEQLGVADRFIASYVGTHGMAHGLDVLIQAAERLRSDSKILILLAGDGAERKRLEAEVERRGLTNIRLLGQLPKTDMPRLWSITDVSLVLLRKLDIFLTVIPSKMFESMAMGKPIILGVAGESAELLEDSGAGICVEPENVDQLVAALRKLANSEALRLELGDRGQSYVKTRFDRRMLADSYEQVLAATAGGTLASAAKGT
jgi:glycosyltransferase involved in cell wall biosynthesis